MSEEINTLYSESKVIQQEVSRLADLVSYSQERIRLSGKALNNTDKKIKKIQFTPFDW
ncbi:MAG: hypothetical protein RIG62_22700 [Cyclobacteriaceae bacterium]